MTPTIRTTYLALSRTGRVVASFDTPRAGFAFVDKQAAMGVTLELVVETTVRKPCGRRSHDLTARPVGKLKAVGHG